MATDQFPIAKEYRYSVYVAKRSGEHVTRQQSPGAPDAIDVIDRPQMPRLQGMVLANHERICDNAKPLGIEHPRPGTNDIRKLDRYLRRGR